MNLENLSKKDKQKILRLRFLDEKYEYLTYGKEDEKSTFWADVYDGKQGFVVYGHQWFNEAKKSKFAIGIDTGCVYGNKLTAIIINQEINISFCIEFLESY